MISTCRNGRLHAPESPKGVLNWSTSEMVRLLKMADEKNLFAPVYRDFLWKTMTETATGSNKLKAYCLQYGCGA